MWLESCCSAFKEVRNHSGMVGRAPIMMQHPAVSVPKGWSLSSDCLSQMPHDPKITASSDALSIRNKLHEDDTLAIEGSDHHHFDC